MDSFKVREVEVEEEGSNGRGSAVIISVKETEVVGHMIQQQRELEAG